MKRLGFSRSSDLAAPPDVVWRHATTFEGVNRELFPLVRMTAPESVRSLDADSIRLGERIARCWILLFGLLPIDYDDLVIVELEPGRRFLERSTMLTQRAWIHERTVEPGPNGGTTITDSIEFEPRLSWLGRLQRPAFAMAFALRHRNLLRLFGSP
jgi:ligand-binding SRPBCC domain-containing protein